MSLMKSRCFRMMWWTTGRLSFDLPLGRRCYVLGLDRSGHKVKSQQVCSGDCRHLAVRSRIRAPAQTQRFFVLRLTFWSGRGIRTSSCRIGCSQWPSPEAEPLALSSTAAVEAYSTWPFHFAVVSKRSCVQKGFVHKVWHSYNSDMMLLSLSLSLLFDWQQYSGVGCSRTIFLLVCTGHQGVLQLLQLQCSFQQARALREEVAGLVSPSM